MFVGNYCELCGVKETFRSRFSVEQGSKEPEILTMYRALPVDLFDVCSLHAVCSIADFICIGFTSNCSTGTIL